MALNPHMKEARDRLESDKPCNTGEALSWQLTALLAHTHSTLFYVGNIVLDSFIHTPTGKDCLLLTSVFFL